MFRSGQNPLIRSNINICAETESTVYTFDCFRTLNRSEVSQPRVHMSVCFHSHERSKLNWGAELNVEQWQQKTEWKGLELQLSGRSSGSRDESEDGQHAGCLILLI